MGEQTPLREIVEWAREPDTRSVDAGWLSHVFDGLEGDALDVIGMLVQRLQDGQRRFGRLDVLTDPRDFAAEADEELEDFLWWSTFEALRRRRRGSDARQRIAELEGRIPHAAPADCPTYFDGCNCVATVPDLMARIAELEAENAELVALANRAMSDAALSTLIAQWVSEPYPSPEASS